MPNYTSTLLGALSATSVPLTITVSIVAAQLLIGHLEPLALL